MTELEILRWILGILVVAGSLVLLVLYFVRDKAATPDLVLDAGASRSELQNSLLSACTGTEGSIPSAILRSEIYEEIQKCIRTGSVINESNPIWERLEHTMEESNPNFKRCLYVLSGGTLKPWELHMAMLIKCGISPADIASLVGRSKSTVTFRRKDIGRKWFDQDLEANRVDEIIRLM